MTRVVAISFGLLLAAVVAAGQGAQPCPDCKMHQAAPALDAAGQPCCPEMSMPGMKIQKQMMIIRDGADLKLTDEQQKQVDDIEYKGGLEIAKYRSELDVNRINFDYEMRKDPPDEGKVKALLSKMGELETSIKVADIMKKLKISKILTPEQRKIMMQAHRCACGKMMP